MDREERIREINTLCREAGCSEKIRKIHFKQFVDSCWHPHPPAEFVDWWTIKKVTTTAKVAWNCQCYREEFAEVKQMIGI